MNTKALIAEIESLKGGELTIIGQSINAAIDSALAVIRGRLEGMAIVDESQLQSKWISVEDRLPDKPGVKSYEHVWCLIFVNGQIELRPWNCEHLVWDNSSGGNFEFKPKDPTHWMPVPENPQ